MPFAFCSVEPLNFPTSSTFLISQPTRVCWWWSIFRRLGVFKVSKIVLLLNSVMGSGLMPQDGQIQNLTTLETFSWQNMLHISYTQKEKLGFNKTGRARMTMPFRALLFSFFLSTKANNWPFSHDAHNTSHRYVRKEKCIFQSHHLFLQ